MNYERWAREGSLDASARAAQICKKTLDAYEAPPLDDSIRRSSRST